MEKLSKTFIIVVLLFFTGCVEPDNENRTSGIEHKIYPIRTEALRSIYLQDMIAWISTTQSLGGADSGFSGGGDLFEAIHKQSVRVFPDGEYFIQDNAFSLPKTYQGYIYWGEYSGRHIYKKP